MGISRDSKHKRRATGGKRKIHRKKRKFELGRPPALTKLGSHRIHPVRCRGGLIKYRALRLETGNYSWPSESVTRKTRILGVVYNASNNELVRTNTLVKSAIVQIDATPFRQWYEQHYGINLGKAKTGAKAAAKKETDATKKEAGKKEAGKKEAGKKEAGKKEAGKKEAAKKEAPKKEAPKKEADKEAAKKEAGKEAGKEAAKKEAGKKEAGAKETPAKKDASKKAAPAVPGVVTDNTRRKLAARRKERIPLAQVLADQFSAGRLYACVTSRPGQCGRCDGYILEGPELEFYLRKMQKKKGKAQQ